MEKIMLKISAIIETPDKESDKIEFVTEGKYKKEGNLQIIEYEESEISGIVGSVTTLIITDESVELKREGESPSIMIFNSGERYTGEYSTPYGVFKLELLTKELIYNLNEDGKGKINIKYDMNIKGLNSSYNSLEIEVY